MRDKFQRFFWTTPIGIITGVPMMLGITLVFLLIVIDLPNNLLQFEPLFVSLPFFMFGSSAIPLLIRKEGFGILRGKLLIIEAYIILIGSWTIALLFLILGYLR